MFELRAKLVIALLLFPMVKEGAITWPFVLTSAFSLRAKTRAERQLDRVFFLLFSLPEYFLDVWGLLRSGSSRIFKTYGSYSPLHPSRGQSVRGGPVIFCSLSLQGAYFVCGLLRTNTVRLSSGFTGSSPGSRQMSFSEAWRAPTFLEKASASQDATR